jgi:hypothetical protein
LQWEPLSIERWILGKQVAALRCSLLTEELGKPLRCLVCARNWVHIARIQIAEMGKSRSRLCTPTRGAQECEVPILAVRCDECRDNLGCLVVVSHDTHARGMDGAHQRQHEIPPRRTPSSARWMACASSLNRNPTHLERCTARQNTSSTPLTLARTELTSCYSAIGRVDFQCSLDEWSEFFVALPIFWQRRMQRKRDAPGIIPFLRC